MVHPIGHQYRITQSFLQKDGFTKANYVSGVHFGVDFACVNVPLMAPADGRVVEIIRNNPTMGNAIRFECTVNGELTSHRFLHLSAIICTLGQVKEGQLLGKTGNTGKGAAYHLHWDIMRGQFVFANLLTEESVRRTMLDPVAWCPKPQPVSEKIDPLDAFTTERLIEEIMTRPHYKVLLLDKIKL